MLQDRALSILAAAEETPTRPAWVFENGEVHTYAQVAAAVRQDVETLQRSRLPTIATVVGELQPEVLTRIYALIELGILFALVHPRWTPAQRERRLALLEGISAVGSSDPLALLFTSGTTGEPKAAVLGRRAFLAAAAASADNLGWRDADRWWLGLPLGHVGGLSVVVRCLIARRTLVLHRPAAPTSTRRGFDAAEVAAVLERCQVTLMSLVPTMLDRLLALDPWRPSPHLRAVLLGGAATPEALLHRARRRGVPVLTTYGSTETCAQVATQRYDLLPRDGGDHPEDGTVGPALAGLELRVSNDESSDLGGDRRPGALEVRGDTLMDGYLTHEPAAQPSSAQLDRSSFTVDGWLRTGDLGQLKALDGVDPRERLRLVGRAKDVIIRGGENIHPAEVEAALTTHPEILAACVFGVEDDPWGESVAAALVATNPDQPPDDSQLIEFLQNKVSSFQRPRRIAFVDSLTLNSTGKVDRRATAAHVHERLRDL